MAAAADGDVARAFDVFLRGMGGDGYRDALRERLGEDGLENAIRDSAFFFADELPAIAEWNFGDAEGSRIAAPILVALGSATAPWFHENVELLATMVPGAQTAILTGLNHVAPLTHPAEMGQMIARFVHQLAVQF